MVNKRTEDIIKLAAKHLIGVQDPIGGKPWLAIERGHGVWLQDTEGREGIDVGSSGGVCHLGHGRKEIINAMVEQMNKIEFSLNWEKLVNPIAVECAQKLAQIAECLV